MGWGGGGGVGGGSSPVGNGFLAGVNIQVHGRCERAYADRPSYSYALARQNAKLSAVRKRYASPEGL